MKAREANSVMKRRSSTTIGADVKRFCPRSTRMTFSAHSGWNNRAGLGDGIFSSAVSMRARICVRAVADACHQREETWRKERDLRNPNSERFNRVLDGGDDGGAG